MSMESRVTFESFLQGCAGKVTTLIGQSGSGKTLLMSNLGQQWASQLVSSLFWSLHKCFYTFSPSTLLTTELLVYVALHKRTWLPSVSTSESPTRLNFRLNLNQCSFLMQLTVKGKIFSLLGSQCKFYFLLKISALNIYMRTSWIILVHRKAAVWICVFSSCAYIFPPLSKNY